MKSFIFDFKLFLFLLFSLFKPLQWTIRPCFSIKKNIFLRNMICFVIHGVDIYVSKHKFDSFEKMYDILMILVGRCGNFSWFWLFLPPGSATMLLRLQKKPKTKKKTTGMHQVPYNLLFFSVTIFKSWFSLTISWYSRLMIKMTQLQLWAVIMYISS